MGQEISTVGPTPPGQLGQEPIAAAMDGTPPDLGLRLQTIRDALPEELREDHDETVRLAREDRTRELQREWTERHQEAADLRRRYEGRDTELQLGQVFTDVRKQNPELAQRAYQLLVSNTIGPVQDNASVSQQPAGQAAQQTGSDVDPVEAKFRQIIAENPESPDVYRAINALTMGRMTEMEQRLTGQIGQQAQAIQQQQVEQRVQQLRQMEADFLAKNPFFNEQKYIDEVHRRQQSERLPGGQPFVTLPPEQQFTAVALPDLITAKAQQRQLDSSRVSRDVANAVHMPGHASPGPPQPPVTEDQAWDNVKEKVSEIPLEAALADLGFLVEE